MSVNSKFELANDLKYITNIEKIMLKLFYNSYTYKMFLPEFILVIAEPQNFGDLYLFIIIAKKFSEQRKNVYF